MASQKQFYGALSIQAGKIKTRIKQLKEAKMLHRPDKDWQKLGNKPLWAHHNTQLIAHVII